MKNNLKNSWIVHHITYQCDNDCSFCIVQDRLKNKQPALSELLEEMHNIETAERYYFTGGEPTKRDDLGLLIKKARTKSNDVRLQTNARSFSNKRLVKSLIEDGLKGAMVSFHTNNKRDAKNILGGEEGFIEAVSGVQNLIDEGIPVKTNTVLTAYNYQNLVEILKFISKEFGNEVGKMRVIYASFNHYNNPSHYVPLSKIKNIVEASLEVYQGKLEIENIPLCIVDSRKYNAHFDKFHKLIGIAKGKMFSTEKQRKYLEFCQSCSAVSDCQGLYKNYGFQFNPELELNPI